MATSAVIREGTLKIDGHNPENHVLELVSKIRPNWEKEKIKIETDTLAGMLNNTALCYQGTEPDDDALVVKIFSDSHALPISTDREHEKTLSVLLSDLGLGPPVRCVFKNGIVFEFIRAKHFQWNGDEFINDLGLIDACTREMARLHSKKTAEAAIGAGINPKPMLLHLTRTMMNNIWQTSDTSRLERLGNFEMLSSELSRIETYLPTLGMPVGICHNDLNPTNVLYQEDHNRAYFVDNDVLGFNYTPADIAGHFSCTFLGLGTDVERCVPPEDYLTMWLNKYLSERKTVGDIDGYNEDDIKILAKQVKKMLLVVQFYLAIGIVHMGELIGKNGPQDYDYVGCAASKLDYYLKHKEELFKED